MFQATINFLSEAVDVYNEWIDAWEEANQWRKEPEILEICSNLDGFHFQKCQNSVKIGPKLNLECEKKVTNFSFKKRNIFLLPIWSCHYNCQNFVDNLKMSKFL